MTREEVNIEFAGLVRDHLMINKQDVLQNSTNHQANQNHQHSASNGCCLLSHQPEERQHKATRNGDKALVGADVGDRISDGGATNKDGPNKASVLSTIAILRRHPMYDSLVLVKRFRACQNGHTLEFPTKDFSIDHQEFDKQEQHHDCCKTKLVSIYLDDDDPIYQCQEKKNGKIGFLAPEGDIVHVPINGLLDRLEIYDRHGVSIDSRVYAFAMGLKTAEKILTTSSMREIQETPPL